MVKLEERYRTRQAAQYHKKKEKIRGMVLKEKISEEIQIDIEDYIKEKEGEDK